MTNGSDTNQNKIESRILITERPWGRYAVYPREGVSSIKIITVNASGSLSLQYHNHRDELWVILDEGLEVTVGEKTWTPTKGEQLWIPRETRHTAKCLSDSPARIFELWVGESNEADIVRIEDVYGRE